MDQPRPEQSGQSSSGTHEGLQGESHPDAQSRVPFEHVAIIGVGLLGASLGMALREHGMGRRVTGIGRSGSESLDIALRRGAVDDISTDPAAGVRGADLIVLATNISAFGAMMDVVATAASPECIITDVGSTKCDVMEMARTRMPGRRFVGSHPMAGSEKTGPGHARADLYRGALCLVVPPEPIQAGPASDGTTDRIIQLWQAVGMRTQIIDAAEHDRWVAVISHVPHVLAAMMVNRTEELPAARAAAAGGFLDTTRVASGSVDMWTDILISNRAIIGDQLLHLRDELLELSNVLKAGDAHAVHEWLARAKKIRDQMVAHRATGR
ncbi:MAG: prephenate dehydrogenase [Phycisphaerae bacterium]